MKNSRTSGSAESRANRERLYSGRVNQRKVEGNVSTAVV